VSKLKFILVFVAFFYSQIAAGEDVLIFGGDNAKEYLGCLSCNEFSSDSVFNEFSRYGWQNGFATWNPFGKFKNPFSSDSACNEFASNPPKLVDRKGNFYGFLTINEMKTSSICGIRGNSKICTALKVMCKEN